MYNNKPAHRGRLLKDPSRPDRLEPIARISSNKSTNQIPSSQPILVANTHTFQPSPRESGDNANVEMLKRRLRDIENENSKLVRHVNEAEKAIQNYRGFLSKNTGISTTIDASVQANILSEAPTIDPAIVASYEERIRALREENSFLRREKEELKRKVAITATMSSESESSTIQSLKDCIQSLQAAASDNHRINTSKSRELQNKLKMNLHSMLRRHKVEYYDFKIDINKLMSDFNKFMGQNHATVVTVIRSMQGNLHAMASELSTSKRSEFTLAEALAKQAEEKEGEQRRLSQIIAAVHVHVGCDPCAELFSPVKHTPVIVKTEVLPETKGNDSRLSSHLLSPPPFTSFAFGFTQNQNYPTVQ